MIQTVDVICKMTASGCVTPLVLEWIDGRKYNIDRVLDIRKVASTKGGGKGTRYTCRIKGQVKYLFLEGYKWFVELPTGQTNLSTDVGNY